MKIIGPEHQQAIKQAKLEKSAQGGGADKKKASERAASKGDSTGSTEKVLVSDRGRDIQKIREVLSGVPDVRQEKVEAIKQQIQDGTYQVKASDIADKILKDIVTSG